MYVHELLSNCPLVVARFVVYRHANNTIVQSIDFSSSFFLFFIPQVVFDANMVRTGQNVMERFGRICASS